MEILALGPVEARVGERELAIGGPKQRALLARLVVARGHPVSVSRLCGDLWAEDAPRDPVHALQARVSRLRSALPPLEIDRVNGGYRLHPASFHADTMRFENLRKEGSALLADGALTQAAERLRDALGLWRGPAFADVPELFALEAEAVRLEELRVSALTDRIDIDIALGNEADVIPELAALVEGSPLRERHWGQLMAALYRIGNRQEALEVYARARAMSADLLGVEPSGELGQLHVRILRNEPPESLLRLPAATRTVASTDAAPGRDIITETSVTSNATDSLARLVRERGALIVTGPGGIGKTHLLRALRERFEAQHCLAPLLSASALSQSIPLGVFAGATGFLAEEWATPAAVINSFARHRSTTVLLVDNVNLLDDSSMFVVTQLISAARVPVVVVTRDLTEAPEAIRALYDSGALTEVRVNTLSDEEVHDLATSITGGRLTPDTRSRIVDAAAGNPLRLREMVTGSLTGGRLVETDFGWELRGEPVPSPRLAQLSGARFDELDQAGVECLSLIAIAGEYPIEALEAAQRRIVARTDVLELSDNGWLRMADPLDREVLRARSSDVLWNDLTREVVRVLKSDLAAGVPQAQRRAHVLALDLGDPIDVPETIALAERALGAFDERLALRAARAVIAQSPANVHAHRLAGAAASALRMWDETGAHFETARRHAGSEAEVTAVALAHARHRGLRLHDAAGALEIVEAALGLVTDPREVGHLRRARMRWAAVAGMGGGVAPPPELPTDAAEALGLIVVGVSGVITGPLDEAHRVLAQLAEVPDELIGLVPGGEDLVALTEIMAVSYSGDMVTTRRLLHHRIAEARTRAPESLGQWEYALGFAELFSGDTAEAHALAASAVDSLGWRDTTGLLPAAQALRAASAQATGELPGGSPRGFDAIPEAAAQDPKVVVLRAWAEARVARAEGRGAEAALSLLETARWLLAAQHTFFAGMLAHCVVRAASHREEAVALLHEAHAVGGGGLLALLLRHGLATVAGDLFELDRIALEARELGLAATAADTWTAVVRSSGGDVLPERRQQLRAAIDQLYAERPALASWIP